MRKVANSPRAPAGLEWVIFRNLPRLVCLGAGVLAAMRLLFGVVAGADDGLDASRNSQILDFAFLGMGVSMLLLAVLVGLGCVIVLIAKGPQYTADSYEVNDADAPS